MTVSSKSARPTTYAKPLSFHPLKMKDALAGLLQVKPEAKQVKKGKSSGEQVRKRTPVNQGTGLVGH